ncbi:MAG TPA: hypothetical protein VI215_09300 [Bacteroidota bacterium]|jgi:hypothetical protein
MRFILLSILALVQSCLARVDQTGAGSRAAALGGACTAVGGDIWSIAFNPGGLSLLERYQVSFFYSPSPFGIRELSTKECAAGIRSPFGVFGIAARAFGYRLYREVSGTISYATSIPRAGFGVALNYHSVNITRYGSAAALAVDAGALIEGPAGLRFGLSVKNATAATLGVSREPLPQVYSIGLSCAPAEELLLAADFRKESGYEASPRIGLEYRIAGAIAIRMGIPDAVSEFAGGLGVGYGPLQLDYALTVHQELGWTHDVTLTVGGGKQP